MARTGISSAERRQALVAAAEQELRALEARGVRMAGNAMSPIVLVKGELNEEERAGGELLAGADGAALRASLLRLGWSPEDFCALSAVAGATGGATGSSGADGAATGAVPLPAGEPLPPELFREALEALDPEAVILLDEVAAEAMREAYADALAIIEDFNTAMLMPGLVARVLGRRVLALGGFEAALGNGTAEKQRMWAYLRQLPPESAPY